MDIHEITARKHIRTNLQLIVRATATLARARNVSPPALARPTRDTPESTIFFTLARGLAQTSHALGHPSEQPLADLATAVAASDWRTAADHSRTALAAWYPTT